jgi:hypothetical protein
MVTEKDIRDMYIHLRKTNNTISDEALNFMKHTCLKALEVNTKDKSCEAELVDEDKCICQGFYKPNHCPVHGMSRNN